MKTKPYNIRLTDEEIKLQRRQAKRAGVAWSEYVRWIVSDHSSRHVYATDAQMRELGEAIRASAAIRSLRNFSQKRPASKRKR